MPVAATNPYTVLVNGVDVDKAELQALLAEINTRLGGIVLVPTSITVGTAVVYGDDGLGPAPASAGTRPILYSGRSIGAFRPTPVDVDGNVTLTDTAHLGCLLRKKTTSATVLTVNLHPNPNVGISDDFACTILRYQGSGDLQITSSLANQHPSANTRVLEGGMATLYVDSEVGWFFKGETEA